MADEMYPGMDDEGPSTPTKTAESQDTSKEKEDDEGETALLPKSFFEGQELKKGDQFYVEIVRQYEDQVEVRYPHKEEEEGEEETPHDKLNAMGKEVGGGY